MRAPVRRTAVLRRVLALAVAAWLAPPVPAQAGPRSFVTFSPAGDREPYRQPRAGSDLPYRSAIPLESWTWVARTPVDGLRLVKRVDRSTPAMFRHLRERVRIPSARLTLRHAGTGLSPRRAPYVEHCLRDVRIMGILTGYEGGDPPVEELIVAYGSTQRRSVVPRADGTPSTTVFTVRWDYSLARAPTADSDCGGASAVTS